ncbi:sugar-transfer associated ATP-grasp domain-containing protein [Maribacter sp. Asnod1-A12]|uniref:sugar-transfer associated ATP-grasp domain-containing protein n=1 Tax=Maribacter sp. Asnod1-A12 TaxID=3160576 RepID=UPI0038675B5D
MEFSDNFKNTIKISNAYILNKYYHYQSNQAAKSALKNIELQNGILNPLLKKQALIYAREVLGWKGYAPWLYVYTAVAGSFKEGWIPDNYYNVIIPQIQGEYGKISFLKPLTNKLLNTVVCPDIAYYINKQWFTSDFKQLPSKEVQKLAFSFSETIVYKSDKSFQGRGISIYNKNTFKLSLIEKEGNGTLQSYITQHHFFNDFMSSSLATIRMTTVMDCNGNSTLRSSYLRLGRKNDTHITSKNHIKIPIESETGRLTEFGYLPNWQTINCHPDTKTVFKNKKIPNYNTCIEKVLNLHMQLPMVKSIGWDLVVDSKGEFILMEWNGYGNDIKFSEATQGPCFADLNWIDR